MALDTAELIRRAERDLDDGNNRPARKMVERVRQQFLVQRDVEGLERLLDLAGRLDDGGDLTYAIRQNLLWLSRDPPQRLQDRPRRVLDLLPALLVHGFGALMWYGIADIELSPPVGTERQFSETIGIGAATWGVAALLMVWLWRSRRATLWVPFAWWLPSFIFTTAVVYS